MANTYKNIVITPNRDTDAANVPVIRFSGGDATTNTDINVRVYTTQSGTLSFEGSAGQLFSITNDLTNSIFSVNDISGIPSIDVYANGSIYFAPYGGQVFIGNTANLNFDSTASTKIVEPAANTLAFHAAQTERMRIDSSGNVLIGRAASTVGLGVKLDVVGGANVGSLLINGQSVLSTIAGANTAVGAGANAFASATIAGANTAVGTGANTVGSAAFATANSRVSSVSGTGTVSGLTLTGTVTTSGSLTLGGTLSASVIDNMTDEHRLFNNMGENHTTRSSFDATTPSYNFGWRYVAGSTNGPATGSQYYSEYVGLGNDYLATGAGSYGMQIAYPRNATTPYISIRYNEGNSFTAWQKISAGYADNAGTLDSIDSTQFMRTDAVSTHTTGKFTVYTPSGVVGTVSSTDNLEIFQPNAGSDAFLTFHISGDYAANFGIDGTTNDLFYGGWSAGANKYRVWHAGNDGTTSGLDADLLDGQHGSYYGIATDVAAAFAKANSTSYTSNVVISVADNTNAALRITQTGTGEAIRVEDSANPDSTPFVVDASGRVGIGTTSLDEPLIVAGAIVSSSSTLANKTEAASFDYASGFTSARILAWGPVGTTANISFWSGSGGSGATERVRIDRNGNFGIGGSATTSYRLQTFGTSPGIGIQNSSTGGGWLDFLNSAGTVRGNIYYDNTSGYMTFGTSPSGSFIERVRIDSSGNTLIGRTTSTVGQNVKLDVAGGVNAASYLINGANYTTAVPENAQTGTTYTLVAADAGKMVTLTNASAITLTIPTNATIPFPLNTRIDIGQGGAGQVTVGGAGVTIRSVGSRLKLVGQYSGATLWKKGTDEWWLIGEIST